MGEIGEAIDGVMGLLGLKGSFKLNTNKWFLISSSSFRRASKLKFILICRRKRFSGRILNAGRQRCYRSTRVTQNLMRLSFKTSKKILKLTLKLIRLFFKSFSSKSSLPGLPGEPGQSGADGRNGTKGQHHFTSLNLIFFNWLSTNFLIFQSFGKTIGNNF